MIGTQRSGSNLLRLMLNQLPEIAAPHPPHILQRFFPLLKYYNNLQQESNLYKLINDVCTLVELNPVPWENIDLDREYIQKNITAPTLIEIYRVIYELNAIHKKSRYWCCKSLANVYYLPEIENSGINPIYLYLYRDGRDVALSFKKAIVGEKHFYPLAQTWHTEQQLALRHCETISEDRVIKVCYEELIHNPKSIIKDICKKLHIEYRSEVMNYFTSEESQRTAQSGEMWANVVNPIMNTNSEKYKREASLQELAIFEGVAGTSLTELGYKNYVLPEGSTLAFSKQTIENFNTENLLQKQEIIKKINPEDINKRNKQENFLMQITNKQHNSLKNF